MQGILYKRLFDRRADSIPDLAPNLNHSTEGASFYAPPRVEGDLTSYCAVSNVRGSVCGVEIAQEL